MTVLIGTSGWSYKDWIGVFYSSEERMLERYWAVFKTTEINSTFYEYPTYGFVRYLLKNTPPGFVYSAKVPKVITHKKLLSVKKDVLFDLKRFLDIIGILKERDLLGPLLIQMPPKKTLDVPEFSKFIESLPDGYEWAIEFRDSSWLTDETFNLLRSNSVAYVIVDEPLLPPIIKVTADFTYVRWHGRSSRPWYYYRYNEQELLEWVPKINELETKVKVVYGYFNNHFRGFAVQNALQFLKLLGKATKEQLDILEMIQEYFKKKAISEVKVKAVEAKSLDELLLLFVNKSRLERGKAIPDSAVFFEIEDDRIIAKVKEYQIIIDLAKKAIWHDCADWAKRIEEKKMCKHLVKLFYLLPEEQSTFILKDISTNIDIWSFNLLNEKRGD